MNNRIFLFLYCSIVKNTGEVHSTLNGLRQLYITVVATTAISFFWIKKFNVDLPYRKKDVAFFAKLEKEQFEKTHDYVYQNYKHKDECTAVEQFCARNP